MSSKGHKLIQEGIKRKDMELVRLGEKMLQEEEASPTPEQSPVDNDGRRRPTSGPVQFKGNTFVDDLKQHRADLKKNVKIEYAEPMERDRPKARQMKCDDCNRTEAVDPMLIKKDPDSGRIYYVCDACLNSRRKNAQ